MSSSSSSESISEIICDVKRQHVKLTHELVPMVILSNEPYFSNLFNILNKISKFKTTTDESLNVAILASKTWDIIMLLPTNRNLLNIFTKPEIISLLNDEETTCSYKLLYNLQIIEIISKYCDDLNNTTIASAIINSTYNINNVNYKELLQGNSWKQKFIEMNCLKQLYGLFIKQMKYAFENNKWNEAFLDCLHIIMKLLVYYLIDSRVLLLEQQQQQQQLSQMLISFFT